PKFEIVHITRPFDGAFDDHGRNNLQSLAWHFIGFFFAHCAQHRGEVRNLPDSPASRVRRRCLVRGAYRGAFGWPFILLLCSKSHSSGQESANPVGPEVSGKFPVLPIGSVVRKSDGIPPARTPGAVNRNNSELVTRSRSPMPPDCRDFHKVLPRL